MKTILLYILPFIFLPGLAQNESEKKVIDSLKLLSKTAAHDTIKIKALQEWDDIIYLTDAELDLSLSEQIKKICEQGLMKGKMNLKEKNFYRKMLSKSINNIGNYYDNKGDVPKAIECYTQSLKIDEETGNKGGMATSLNNIGNVYSDQGDNTKALDYYNQSIKIREEIKDEQGLAMCYNNISNIYNLLGNFEKALDYSFKSLAIREKIGNKKGASISLNNIGSIYSEHGEYAKAQKFYLKSMKLKEKIGDSAGIAVCYLNIGITFNKQGMLDKGIEFTKKALALGNQLGTITTTKNASQALFESYKTTGKYRDALEMHELTIKLRDSIVSEENKTELMRTEMQYNYEKQKALDEKEQEKIIAIATEQEKKQKVISYSIAVGLILVILFTLFVVNRLRITRSQKITIEHQKHIVEEKQKEILDSINYAKRLQEAILPPSSFVKQHLSESFILYKPKDIVAGDFYWMEVVSSESEERRTEKKNDMKPQNSQLHPDSYRDPDSKLILIAAADCTGHGVPGAMVSVVCSNALNRTTLEFGITEPGKILDKARELVLETFSRSDKDVKDGMDISLCSIARSKDNNEVVEVKWAGANNALYYVSDGDIHEISPDKQAIGKTEKPVPFKTNTLNLKKGDSLFLFTDGFADQFGGAKGKKFKSKQLKDVLLKNASLPCEQQKIKLENIFEKWKGNLEQIDDVCIIGLRL